MAIEISTAEQFMALRIQADRGTADIPLDVIITADLDFSNVEDYPDMDVINANINGQGHMIKNIACVVLNRGLSFFRLANGVITNLTIDNCFFSINGTSSSNSWFNFFNIYDTTKQAIITNVKINNNCSVYCNLGDPKPLALENVASSAEVIIKNISFSGTWSSGQGNVLGIYFGSCKPTIQMSNISLIMFINASSGIHLIYGAGSSYSNYLCITNMFARINGSCSSFSIATGGSSRLYAYFSFFYLSVQNYSGTIVGAGTFYKSLFDNDSTATCTFLENVPASTLKSAEAMRALGWVVS